MEDASGGGKFDASDLAGMVTQITAGATGALGNITMVDAGGSGQFDKDDLAGMITKITSGATGALGNISMKDYSSDNISAFTTTITSSVTDSLSNITMDGYNPSTDNLSSSVTSGASSAALVFLGSDNVTGTYSITWGSPTTGGCINNGTALSAWASLMPSGTASFKIQKIFTSGTSFTKKYSFYSDSSCSTETGYVKYGYKDITVGAAVTVTLPSGDGPTRPSDPYQVKYSKLNVITKGNTSLAVTYLNTFGPLGGITHTSGVEQTNRASGTLYDIWATGVNSGNTWLFSKWDPSTTAYPTAWSQNDDISFK
jgi:hypothetical protein